MTETKRIHGTILYNPSPNLASKHSIYTSGFMQTLWDERKVWVSDMRGQERQFDIDKQGFEVIEHNSSETEFMNEEAIRNTYYPELEDLLKRTLSATTAIPVSHAVRRRTWAEAYETEKDLPSDGLALGLYDAHLRFPHVDQSYTGARIWLKQYVPAEQQELVDHLTQYRWAIVTAWRPIRHIVTRGNLALCDARSVSESDIYEDTENLTELKQFSTSLLMAPREGKEHHWHYLSNMTPGEVLLLKGYDSKIDGRARRAPHCAFVSDEDHGPVRESIEVRSFVAWEGEERD